MIGANAELGYRSIVATEPEVSFGIAITTTAATNYLEVTNVGVSVKIDELKSPEMNSTRDFSRRFQMNKNVDGSVEKSLHPVDGIDFLRHAIGGDLTTTALSTGVYAHTLTPNNSPFAVATATETSLTIDVRKGPNRGYRYTGARVNNMTVSAEIGSPLAVSYETIGQNVASLAAASVATDTAVNFSSARPFLFQDVSFQFASNTAALTSTIERQLVGFELSVTNNLDTDTRALGTDTVIDLPGGRRDISLKLTMRADTSTVYEEFVDGAKGAARIVIDGAAVSAADNYSLVFTLPEVYVNGADPEIGDEGVIQIEPELTAISSAATTTSYAIQAILTNDVASY